MTSSSSIVVDASHIDAIAIAAAASDAIAASSSSTSTARVVLRVPHDFEFDDAGSTELLFLDVVRIVMDFSAAFRPPTAAFVCPPVCPTTPPRRRRRRSPALAFKEVEEEVEEVEEEEEREEVVEEEEESERAWRRMFAHVSWPTAFWPRSNDEQMYVDEGIEESEH